MANISVPINRINFNPVNTEFPSKKPFIDCDLRLIEMEMWLSSHFRELVILICVGVKKSGVSHRYVADRHNMSTSLASITFNA